MIDYLIGVDGGGTGTRVRLAGRDGAELASGQGGPSGLAHGIDAAWNSVDMAIEQAFGALGAIRPAPQRMAIGLGLAGVHNPHWAAQFTAADPGYGALLLNTDAITTLLGAHQGRPGVIVAIGTGSVGQALLEDGSTPEVGGWGFPAGDEASGAWLGLRAINYVEQMLDARLPESAFGLAVAAACGSERSAIQQWLGKASQTDYATLAPIVIAHAGLDPTAQRFLVEAGREVAAMALALDRSGRLPLALCGGLGALLRPYLPADLQQRCVAPHGDAASGALRMIASHVNGER
jgi:glucosamine kinase